jgi:4-amino-4-deoxy-L-arabinose transferase-like glycosyltransferase
LNEIPGSDRHSWRWTAPLSAAAMAICLFCNLGAIGLTGPDEPRYAWIARAMAETGDWVTPRLYGQPWFEKPVLYYWAAALGFLLHLPAEWAARLPSAIAALAAALTIGWLAKRHYGGDPRSVSSPVLLAPLIFATSVAAIGFARAATPDMLFSAAIAGAMACAATIFRHSGALHATANNESKSPRGDYLPLLLFGVALGLAVLAKGPAALILAGGGIAIWGLATRQWRVAMRVARPISVVAFCVVSIPWYALCAARNPDFLRVFFWQHNFERYTTPMFQHRQPVWYFGPIMLLALLPWTVLLWPVAQQGLRLWREKAWTHSPGLFFACWVVWPMAFFSFSQSKLPGYILPGIPPLTLLCSIAAIRLMSRGPLKSKAALAGLGLTWVAIGIAAVFAAPRDLMFVPLPGRVDVSPGLFAAAISLIAGILVLGATLRGRSGTVLLLCAVLVAASVEIASLRLLPPLDPEISARPHAEFVRNDQHPDRIFTYQLRRRWTFGLNFYFRRELPEWSPADPLPALVLTTPAGLDQIKKLGRVSSDFEQTQPGVVYVPIMPVPPSHQPR